MAEFPALPLFTDAYLGDTTHLTTIEHGAYLLLLMAAWRSPGTRLPNDDRKLARYARLGAQQWARLKPTIMDFFQVEGEWITQRRLTDEAVAVRQQRERQAEKGRASALKRKGRHATAVKSGCDPVATEGQPEGNLPKPTPTIPLSNDNGASAVVETVDQRFWREGKAYIGGSDSMRGRDPGKRIGGWLSKYGKAATASAITAAQVERAVDPAVYVEGILRKQAAAAEGHGIVEAPC